MKTLKCFYSIIVTIVVFLCFSFTNIIDKEKEIKNFSLKSVNNKTISLNDYKDAKGFVIVFTCNKCPMAKLYTERLNQINDKFKKQQIYLLAINSMDTVAYAEESFKLMQKKAKKENLSVPYLQDKKQKVAKQFNATHTPQSFIIWKNKDDKLIIKYQGAIDDNAAEPQKAKNHFLIDALQELLSGKEVTLPKSESFGCKIFFRGEKQKMN
ncbi:thioredoxin family protein [Flavobacterium chungnamense]|uniref:Thioredoxin domain-containing protein n=1 Tax=Flavobacterium chungnamense TaxID=706182 RepID=A0ABP7UXJ8_9FLAO